MRDINETQNSFDFETNKVQLANYSDFDLLVKQYDEPVIVSVIIE